MSEFGFMDDVEVRDVSPDFGDDRDGLSPLLREFERLIGLELTLRLVERWGGVMLYIPATVNETQAIVEVIGLEAAEKLAAYCGREHISMPKADEYKRLKRDHEIFQKKRSGVSAPELAKQYDLTQRQIWAIIATEKVRIQKQKYKQMMKGGFR